MTSKLSITCFFLLVCCHLLIGQVGIVDSKAVTKPELVILGTYHMGKAGNNVINTEYEDVTTPERQKQMVALIDRLKKFKPTKIVLECDIEDDKKIQKRFEKYLTGNYQLTRNETDQIGFRLAKELRHNRIYCVDWGIFPDDPLFNFQTYATKDPEMEKFLENLYAEWEVKAASEKEKLYSKSIIDQLIFINRPERIEKEHRVYFDIMRIGRGDEYVGANYLSWWYGRNMKILMNIIRITDSMDDRILAVYGAGHTKLLTQFAKESEFYTVKSPLQYLEE